MAFLPSSSTKTLYAYLTQRGREYVLSGDKLNFRVTQFSLHDDDVNYGVTKNLVNDDYNKLPKGFVPDLTGDNDSCISSIASGIYVKLNCILTGDTTGRLKQTRDVFVKFESPSYNATLPTNTSQISFTESTNIKVLLTPGPGDSNAITSEELANVKFRVNVTLISQAITNVKINGTLNQSSLISFTNTTEPLNLTFDKVTTLPSGTYDSTIKLRITFSENSLVDLANNTFTYNIPITIQ